MSARWRAASCGLAQVDGMAANGRATTGWRATLYGVKKAKERKYSAANQQLKGKCNAEKPAHLYSSLMVAWRWRGIQLKKKYVTIFLTCGYW